MTNEYITEDFNVNMSQTRMAKCNFSNSPFAWYKSEVSLPSNN